MGKRVEKKLDARTVATLKEAGRHSDGGGLYLSISKDGRRRWVFMYTRGGRRTELGLGSARDVSLADARRVATDMRSQLAQGLDPRRVRKRDENAMTFGQFADAYVEQMRPSWRNAKHADQWSMTLTRYCRPIRGKLIRDITTEDVLQVLTPIWLTIPETAGRLRGRMEAVIDAAKARGLYEGGNPAVWRGHLKSLLPKQPNLTRGHHKALPYEDVPTFMERLRGQPGIAARALEFTILTAARTGEVLGATLDEIDPDRAVWTIPADRMKAGVVHRIPLSDVALAVPQDIRRQEHDRLVFPGGKPGKPLSNMAMATVLRRMQVDATVHGFRSSFRDWAAGTTSVSREVCEQALAHAIPDKAEAAYRRGDLFNKRRHLMNAWARYCRPVQSEKVVPLLS